MYIIINKPEFTRQGDHSFPRAVQQRQVTTQRNDKSLALVNSELLFHLHFPSLISVKLTFTVACIRLSDKKILQLPFHLQLKRNLTLESSNLDLWIK